MLCLGFLGRKYETKAARENRQGRATRLPVQCGVRMRMCFLVDRGRGLTFMDRQPKWKPRSLRVCQPALAAFVLALLSTTTTLSTPTTSTCAGRRRCRGCEAAAGSGGAALAAVAFAQGKHADDLLPPLPCFFINPTISKYNPSEPILKSTQTTTTAPRRRRTGSLVGICSMTLEPQENCRLIFFLTRITHESSHVLFSSPPSLPCFAAHPQHYITTPVT